MMFLDATGASCAFQPAMVDRARVFPRTPCLPASAGPNDGSQVNRTFISERKGVAGAVKGGHRVTCRVALRSNRLPNRFTATPGRAVRGRQGPTRRATPDS